MKKDKPELSIIVVTHNSSVFIKDFMNSISSQKNISYELIFVDNNSDDDTTRVISRYKSALVIKRTSILGFSAANNIGVNNAKGKYLLFLNADITFDDDHLLEKLLKKYKSNKSYGALTPKILLASSKKIDETCHRGFPTPWAGFTHFSGLRSLFPKSKIFSQYTLAYLGYDNEHEVDSVGGMFLLISKKKLESVGGWDEDYPLYGEDIDLCYRLKQSGLINYYYPKLIAYHHKGASTGMSKHSKHVTTASKDTTKRVKTWSIDAMKIFYRKHYVQVYPKPLNYLVFLGIKLLKIYRTKSL